MKTSSQSGFTLIEIVMVLVLLGILTAVAVPKYFDLQDKAREKTALLAVAEAQHRLNAQFAQLVLDGSTCKAAVEAVSDITKLGDSKDGTAAVFGEFKLTLAGALTSAGTAVTVATKDGTLTMTTTPKLYAPACSSDTTTTGGNTDTP